MLITFDNPTLIVITLNRLSEDNGKTFSDITDVKYMFKRNASDTDGDAVFSKTLGSGITLANDKINVNILKSDYGLGKIESGKGDYLICLGVEFNNSGEFIEDKDHDKKNRVTVFSDKIRS